MERFESTGCLNCHNGPMFSDFTAHVLGVPDNPKLPQSDAGVNNTYAFRTASLRNLNATGPYMHNGVFTSLSEVINFYQRISGGGGRRAGRGTAPNLQVSRDQIDPLVLRLNMRGRGQRDLMAFLRALNDPSFDKTIPERVPSGLPVGGRLQP
jgi:cytochrome c peroxidase